MNQLLLEVLGWLGYLERPAVLLLRQHLRLRGWLHNLPPLAITPLTLACAALLLALGVVIDQLDSLSDLDVIPLGQLLGVSVNAGKVFNALLEISLVLMGCGPPAVGLAWLPERVVGMSDGSRKATELIVRYAAVSLGLVGMAVHLGFNSTAATTTYTGSDRMRRSQVSVGAGHQHDPASLIALLEATASAVPRALAKPAPKALLVSYRDSAIHYTLRFWITNPMENAGVCSEVNQAIWRAFAEHGLEIPFPQQVQYERPWPAAEPSTAPATG